MIAGSRVVFIVGFERCMTSSLARHLVENGYCSLLVDGVKEPGVFSSDPKLAVAMVREKSKRSRTWLLDASVNYAGSRATHEAIVKTVEDYRIIVCMRDQFERTVSAFKMYQGRYTLPSAESTLYDPIDNYKYGTYKARTSLVTEELAPAYFRRAPVGRYFYTNLLAAEGGTNGYDASNIDRYDRAIELFSTQRLPVRIVYEWRHLARTGRFPEISILANSYFADALRNMLFQFEATKILLTTLQPASVLSSLDLKLGTFLGLEQESMGLPGAFPKAYASDRWGAALSLDDVSRTKYLTDVSFREDTDKVLSLLRDRTDIDLSLFSADALYH